MATTGKEAMSSSVFSGLQAKKAIPPRVQENWFWGGEGKSDIKKRPLSLSSLFSFLFYLPLAVSANDIIKLSSYLTAPTSQCWKAKSYHLHPRLMHWSELWVPSRFLQNWRLSWGQYKNISQVFSWHSPTTWMTSDLCFCARVLLSCLSRGEIILKSPVMKVSVSLSGLTVLWKSVNA